MLYQNENNTIFFLLQEFKRYVSKNTTIPGKLGVQPSLYFYFYFYFSSHWISFEPFSSDVL